MIYSQAVEAEQTVKTLAYFHLEPSGCGIEKVVKTTISVEVISFVCMLIVNYYYN